MLTIKTNRKKKAKKQKNKRPGAINATQQDQQSDSEAENNGAVNPEKNFDPNKPDDLGQQDQIEDEEVDFYHDEEEDETSEEEISVERQFNFAAEISLFVDYDVIGAYLSVIESESTSKRSNYADLLQMIASFFKRIAFQLKQTWIFF